MEKENVLVEAEFVADNAWNNNDRGRVELLREDPYKRQFIAKPRQAAVFERILDNHLYVENEMKGPAPVSDTFSDSLPGILKAFREREVYARSEHDKRPRLVSLVLNGNQVADIYTFAEQVDAYHDIPPIQKKLMHDMTEGFIANFPTAPVIEDKSRIKDILQKINRIKNKKNW